ncbi:MAG: hypothetical protein GXO73_14215 [Calditrichaeota bacterium]|nr:hypothetical protein [Calditrichota bacterium]
MAVTIRERILRTFRKDPIDRVVWQPRLYYWFYGNRLRNRPPAGVHNPERVEAFYRVIEPYEGGHVPEQYRNLTLLELYRALHASPRYPQETLGVDIFEVKIDESRVKVHQHTEGDRTVTVYETPRGQIRQVAVHGYPHEHFIKGPDDIPVMIDVLEHSTFVFDEHNYRIADEAFGDLGVINTYYPRAPFQRLVVDYMGFENLVYALADYPDKIADLLKAIEAWDDQMYEVLLASPVPILNFGDNIDAYVDPPPYFERYLVPYYQKRIAQIHAAGKFCHIHMDGALKPLLPYLGTVGFDAIEAATPLPQGDVTLEELKEALGDTILMDGIPALLFLPSTPEDELLAFAEKVLDMFAPRLILGISDELPPGGEIERVRKIADLVESYELRQN